MALSVHSPKEGDTEDGRPRNNLIFKKIIQDKKAFKFYTDFNSLAGREIHC